MKLKRVYIEITNVCNLSCPFCPPCGRAPRFMSEEEFAPLAAQAAGLGAQVYFHVKGEPLLHPLVERFLQIASERGAAVNITTNGTLLGEKGKILLGGFAPRQVNISLHSSLGDAEYLKTAAEFGLAAAERGPIVSYRLWNGSGGQMPPQSRADMEYLCGRFGVAVPDEPRLGREAVKLGERSYISFEQQFEWPDMALPELGSRGKCLGGRQMLAVLADGTAVPCCLDGKGDMPLGNAFRTPLSELLDSPRLAALNRGFCENRLTEPLCRRCGYRLTKFGE